MTKLIPLEEVQKILVDYCDELPRHWIRQRGARADMGLKILRLPNIDPIATIDEMIEDRNETERRGLYLSDNEDYVRQVLQELKYRLSLTQK